MSQPIERVVFEPNGQVRDRSGKLVGEHDPSRDVDLRALHRYVGECSRGVRLLAANVPQGDLGQPDVQTQGTIATSLAAEVPAIADIVCPVTPIRKTSGTWLAEDVAYDMALPVLPQTAGTSAPKVLGPKLTSAGFDASGDLSLAVELPTETIENADLDLVKLGIRRLVNAFKLDREIRIAALLMTATNFPSGQQTAAAAKWNGGVSPTPLVDIFTAMSKSLIAPTHMVVSEAVEHWLFTSTDVFQYLAAGGKLPEIVVGRARKTTSGAAAYVWGAPTSANIALVFAPKDDPEAVSTARTFRYIGDAPDKEAAAESGGYLLRSFVYARAGARGVRSLVLTTNDADKILSGQLGGIITGVLA